MKLKRIRLVLGVICTSIMTVLANVLAANFPNLPHWVIWSGGGAILVGMIVFDIIEKFGEEKQKEQVPSQKKPLAPQQIPYNEKLSSPSPNPLQAGDRVLHEVSKIPTGQPLLVDSIGEKASTISPIHGQPTIEHPMLLCLAIDVSASMKKPILDHTGKSIQRWTSISDAIEHFVQLGIAWVKDPETQRVLPLYHLLAYGFGFKETVYGLGMRKEPGGRVRDLLAHPQLTSFPSASELSDHWNDYKNNLLSYKRYTGDLFGSTPLCEALITIRERIKSLLAQKEFTMPILLFILSDGLPDDGDPLPLTEELHTMNVLTLCCYMANKDVLATKRMYDAEEADWSDGAKLLFRCASVLRKDTYVSESIFNYLNDHDWHPHEGVRLFAQVNQAEALGKFLEVLLQGLSTERMA
jgi:hypothetical protein